MIEQRIEFRGKVPDGHVQVRPQLPKSLFQQVTAIGGVEQPVAPAPCFDTPQHALRAVHGRGIWLRSFVHLSSLNGTGSDSHETQPCQLWTASSRFQCAIRAKGSGNALSTGRATVAA